MYKLGIIGYPLSHSISAVIQKAGFDSLGLEGAYDVLETTPEDLRKGEFEVVLKPDKTTTYKSVHKFRGVQGRSCEREYDFTVVVLEPEKYDSVMQLRSTMNNQQRGIQFRELKGEKVDPWEKEIINKLAKMSPKERREYEKKLERQYSRMRK